MTTYPKEFFDTPPPEEPGYCFAIMPFAREFASTYAAIKSAAEDARVGFVCRRADEVFGGHQIMHTVLTELARAQVVIADLTSRNPNVFYELGLAHMCKPAERVLLLTQRLRDVPFDLRAYRCIQYLNSSAGRAKLRGQVAESILQVASGPYRFNLAPGESHETGPQFEAPDRCLYAVLVSHPILGPRFAKCLVQVSRHVVGHRPKGILHQTYGFQIGEATQLGSLPWALRLEDTNPRAGSAAFSIVPFRTAPRTSGRPNPRLHPTPSRRSRAASRRG